MAALRRIGSYLKSWGNYEKPVTGRDLQFRSETLLIYSFAVGSKFASGRSLPEALSQCAESVLLNSEEHPSFKDQVVDVKNYMLGSTFKTLRSISDLRNADADDLDEQLKEAHGFVPVVQKSSIPNGGNGLFIEGCAKAGTIIALYPGICYMPSDLYRIPNCLEFTQRNEYLMWRYDGIVIDGEVALEIESSDSDNDDDDDVAVQEQTEQESMGIELITHPFSNGHLANHAPLGHTPNCLQFHMNIPINRNSAPLRRYIPNSMYFASRRTVLDGITNTTIRQKVSSVSEFGVITGADNCIPTLAFVATRDIQDEEVFINYRYNPNGPKCPSWYHDCDPESSTRRWADGDKVFFRS